MKDLFDLLANTADGVFAVDRCQRIVFWNEGARRLLGFQADSVRGRLCFELLQGRDESRGAFCKRRCAAFRAAEENSPPASADLEVKTHSGGDSWINVTTLLMPSSWSGRTLLVHLFRDVTRSVETRGRLESSRREASPSLGARPPLELLTTREIEILQLLAAGASTESICRRLLIGRATVRTHVKHILSKLGVHSRLEAVAAARRYDVA